MERLLFFDIDGTLTRTNNGYLPFNEAVYKTFGVGGDIRLVVPDGKTDPMIVREIFAHTNADIEIDEGQWERFSLNLRQSYVLAVKNGITTIRALPGVSNLLRALSERDIFACSVVTGNMEFMAKVKLETAGLLPYLGRGAYGSDSPHRSDLPALARQRWQSVSGRSVPLEQCIVIGDTPRDLDAARQNKMKCILVGTGRFPYEELAYCNPDACLPDLSDTVEVMKALANL